MQFLLRTKMVKKVEIIFLTLTTKTFTVKSKNRLQIAITCLQRPLFDFLFFTFITKMTCEQRPKVNKSHYFKALRGSFYTVKTFCLLYKIKYDFIGQRYRHVQNKQSALRISILFEVENQQLFDAFVPTSSGIILAIYYDYYMCYAK